MAHIPPPWHPRSRQQRGAIFRTAWEDVYTHSWKRTIPKCVNLLDQRFVPFARKSVCTRTGSVTRCLVNYVWNLQFIARLNPFLFINRQDAVPRLCLHPSIVSTGMLEVQRRRWRGLSVTLCTHRPRAQHSISEMLLKAQWAFSSQRRNQQFHTLKWTGCKSCALQHLHSSPTAGALICYQKTSKVK